MQTAFAWAYFARMEGLDALVIHDRGLGVGITAQKLGFARDGYQDDRYMLSLKASGMGLVFTEDDIGCRIH